MARSNKEKGQQTEEPEQGQKEQELMQEQSKAQGQEEHDDQSEGTSHVSETEQEEGVAGMGGAEIVTRSKAKLSLKAKLGGEKLDQVQEAEGKETKGTNKGKKRKIEYCIENSSESEWESEESIELNRKVARPNTSTNETNKTITFKTIDDREDVGKGGKVKRKGGHKSKASKEQVKSRSSTYKKERRRGINHGKELREVVKELKKIKHSLGKKRRDSSEESSESSGSSSESERESRKDSSESDRDSSGEDEQTGKRRRDDEWGVDRPTLKHLSDLAGGKFLDSYVPSSLPLSTFVKNKVKKKIWTHKYVDFVKLLDEEERPKRNSFALEVVNGKVSKSKKSVHLPTFRLWDKSFMVFISVHASNPDKNVDKGKLINDLLCYRQTIMEMSYQNYDWARYDRKFRQFVENTKQPIYNYRMQDLIETCKIGKNVSSIRDINNRNVDRGKTSEVCYGFQKGECTRTACRFQHRCQTCNGTSHGSRYCRIRKERELKKFNYQGKGGPNNTNKKENANTG